MTAEAAAREAFHFIRRQGVVERAALEISNATVKGSKRVRELWLLANSTWTEKQIIGDAAVRDYCGIFALAMLHAEGLGVTVNWEIGGKHPGFASRLPQTKEPEPGDVFVDTKPNAKGVRVYHHGLIEERYQKDGKWWLRTIEGNTPGVVRRDRPEPVGLVYYSIEPWIDGALAA